MLRVLLELVVTGALGLAAVLKLARPAEAAAAFGRGGRGGVTVLAGTELLLAAAVLSGRAAGAFAAAGVLGLFALYLGVQIARGRAGAPCPCFGARSRITPLAVARTSLLAAAALGAGLLPARSLSTDSWLGLGLAAALLGVAALALAVAALARELGRLRLELRPQGALEVPEEGPALGARLPSLRERFDPGEHADLLLAVFSSEACGLCRTLAPAVAALAREPFLALETFEEGEDAEVWRALGVPGSPYAVALTRDGTVRAKGTWNTPGQLEGLLATAERRAAEGALA